MLCTKRVGVSERKRIGKDDALLLARLWCVQSVLCTRKGKHGEIDPHCLPMLAEDAIELEMLNHPPIPAVVHTDEYLDWLDAEEEKGKELAG